MAASTVAATRAGASPRATAAYGRRLASLWARIESLVQQHGRTPLGEARGTAQFETLRTELRLLAALPDCAPPSVRPTSSEQLRLAAIVGDIAALLDAADERAPARDPLERAQDEIWCELASCEAVEWLETLVAAACRMQGEADSRADGPRSG